MRVHCTRCGKKKTKSPNEIRKYGRTPETYLCRECRTYEEPRHTGRQEILNHFKDLGEQYKTRHGGCFAGRD